METLGNLVNVILIEVIVGGRADSNILKVRILGWGFVGVWGRPAVLWWGVKKNAFFAGKTDSEATLKVGSERNSSQKWFVVETFQIEELKMTQKFDFNI